MENRDRDKVSRNNVGPTDAGEVNRETSQREGEQKSDSNANFGQNIGRSEDIENEPSRRSGGNTPNSGNPSRGNTGSMSGSEH